MRENETYMNTTADSELHEEKIAIRKCENAATAEAAGARVRKGRARQRMATKGHTRPHRCGGAKAKNGQREKE